MMTMRLGVTLLLLLTPGCSAVLQVAAAVLAHGGEPAPRPSPASDPRRPPRQ